MAVESMPFWLGNCETKNGVTELYNLNRHIKAGQPEHDTLTSNIPEYHRRNQIGAGSIDPVRADIAEYVAATLYD